MATFPAKHAELGSILPSEETQKEPLREMFIESAPADDGNLHYDNTNEEPELSYRTYIAVFAMLVLSLVQNLALTTPPTVLSYIVKGFPNANGEAWIANVLTFVSAWLGPVLSSASDTFQVRKSVVVATCFLGAIGAGIAPGSHGTGRLIAAQTLIGFGFASMPLAYAIPGEILPRKWRAMISTFVNASAVLGATIGPLIIGALTKADQLNGWRRFYWIELGLWLLAALGVLFGYRPPKRHTQFDHLLFFQKVKQLDLPGCSLLTAGLALFLTALTIGGGMYSWTNARTLSTMVSGLAILVVFGLYEWKVTKTGILHHDLFRGGELKGRTFAICCVLFFIEGLCFATFLIVAPLMSTILFTTDPFIVVARGECFNLAQIATTFIYGYVSTRLRDIRGPLFVGFLIVTAGLAASASLQPNDNFKQLAFMALTGIGFGAPCLIISGVQLSTPHRLIATATAVTVSFRAVGATVFGVVYYAALDTRLQKYLPNYIETAARTAGLQDSSIPAFVTTLITGDTTRLAAIVGVTPAIITAGQTAFKQAYADSLRVVYMITPPFGVAACIACLFLGDLRKAMDYRVEAPVEKLEAAKHRSSENAIHGESGKQVLSHERSA
ncbi:hypothetical protein LTR93_011324 [Exophiala xenobiotica]|nr:hypothetical protein LTR93_011324 [Exophiala xenobiotica]